MQSPIDWYRKNLVRSHDYEMEFSCLFFQCFFLFRIFVLSLLLGTSQCCPLLLFARYIAVAVQITIHIHFVVVIWHQSCPLWPLLLRPSLVFLPQLLHWDLAHLAGAGRQCWPRLMCPVHIYWFSFYSRFIFLSIPLPGHVQNDHRGEREKRGVTKPSAISAVIGLSALPFLVKFRRLSHRKMLISWQTYVRSFFSHWNHLFVVVSMCFFSSMALNIVCRFLHPFIKKYTIFYINLYACVCLCFALW